MARATSGNASGWIASLLGGVVLIAAGFLVGLIVGVISEEPDLVVDHLAGRSEEVAWNTQVGSGPDGAPAAPAPETGSPLGDGAEAPAPASVSAAPPAGPPAAPAAPAAPPAARATPAPTARPSDPPPSRAPAADPRSGFAVQVGAFSESEGATRLAEELRVAGFASYVSAGAGDGRWRVRVGPVPGRAEAESLAGRLKAERGLPTWVLDEGTN